MSVLNQHSREATQLVEGHLARGVITDLGLQVLTLRLCSEGLNLSGMAGSGQAEKSPESQATQL